MIGLLRTARFMLGLAARLDRGRLIRSGVLMLLGYAATPFIALGLRDLTNAALSGDVSAATIAALVVAVLLTFELMLGHFAHLSYFEVGELAEVALNEELLRHVNAGHGLERVDDPEFADGVTMVQEELVRTRVALEAVLQLGGLLLQVLVTTVVLAMLNPWLLLLPVAALAPVFIGKRAQATIDAAKENAAETTRQARHLLELATTPAAIKEIRLFHGEQELLRRHERAWSASTRLLWRAHRRAATLRSAGQSVFALAYGGAVVLIISQVRDGRADVGDVVLVITLAVQVAVQVASALNLLALLQGVGRTVARLTRLRRSTGAATTVGTESSGGVPERLNDGIVLENVSFHYPGTDRLVLRDINLRLPAGGSVAIVGENGAGKSTLVKLLCGLYQPVSGRILLDHGDLADVPDDEWRKRVAPLFQDFARFELLVRESVGLGDVARVEDRDAVADAVDRAEAGGAVAAVPGGLDGLLGKGYGDGAELSGGQWQRLGLARTMMRDRPLLLVLDEPAAALDAAAEHAIFERYRDSAGRVGAVNGGVTLFVSHRFSTVRMADLIVVLDGGRVAESGSHAELMARGGLYAELFGMQARVST
ncbi:ATP-binding cassette domain-containing protein [Micromonospora sediminimaris]|uniref:ATP-binding cassette domain-containing protein n=1 Tax=Micromonospora TaxID=1873 RepID=UPI00249C6B2C|nr:ABC transporter ATP-binding protein [Verrucosispora sp. WMMD1129]WFE47854.1 ABC transporter ATP-binding protein [Verrucosispora sp. WMMD1129]